MNHCSLSTLEEVVIEGENPVFDCGVLICSTLYYLRVGLFGIAAQNGR